MISVARRCREARLPPAAARSEVGVLRPILGGAYRGVHNGRDNTHGVIDGGEYGCWDVGGGKACDERPSPSTRYETRRQTVAVRETAEVGIDVPAGGDDSGVATDAIENCGKRDAVADEVCEYVIDELELVGKEIEVRHA